MKQQDIKLNLQNKIVYQTQLLYHNVYYDRNYSIFNKIHRANWKISMNQPWLVWLSELSAGLRTKIAIPYLFHNIDL